MRGRGLNIKRPKAEDKKMRSLEVEKKISTSQPLNLSTSDFSTCRTPNSKLIFILGGARSGKSAYALKLAESMKGRKLYLATAEALDSEMAERIKQHKKDRGDGWTTIEEPIKIAEVIAKNKKYDVLLLDCLTLWVSNLMHTSFKSEIRNQKSEIPRFISACKNSKANIIVVSNEVGMGIVPDNPLARKFRDIAGYANQKMAEAADEVYFVAAGIAMRMK